jgi:hypothetical protein
METKLLLKEYPAWMKRHVEGCGILKEGRNEGSIKRE